MKETLLQLKQVSMRFKTGKQYIQAVNEVSLDFNKGETVTIMGESGCGKSTLGRLSIGLTKPSSGQILYKNSDVWGLDKKTHKTFRRSAQLVHQNPYGTFNPMKTIFDALSAPILHYGVVDNKKSAWEKAKELLEIVALEPPEDFLDRYPHQLSGGQLQRIAIARTISIQPEFVVADEITSMLDASLRIEVLDLLLALKEKFGITYMFISHDFPQSKYFASRGKCIIMYLGDVVEEGTVEDLLQKALHPYTEALILSTPIKDPELARKRPLPKLRSLDLPDPVNPPSGCKFHPRCPEATELCEKTKPELIEVEKGRLVACHKYR